MTTQVVKLTTVTGRPITVATGFRLKFSLYQKAVEIAAEEETTLSAKTAQLWEQEVERQSKLTNKDKPTRLTIESEQEPDGRWLAEVLESPGVIAYGESQVGAIRNVLALLEARGA